MRTMAARFAVVLALVGAGLTFDAQAQQPVRAAPTRPGATPSAPATTPSRPATTPQKSSSAAATKKKSTAASAEASATALLSLSEIASRLGFTFSAASGNRPSVLSGRGHRVELNGGSREVTVDGLRMFLGEPVLVRSGKLHLSRIDYERRLLPILRPDLVRPRLVKPRIIAIDPGHGGVDRGTRNPKLGLEEKGFALDVAKRLERLLEARGFKVVLTRTEDVKLELAQRALIANRANADLFVSIHFNSLPNDARTRGAEIFTFAPQYQRSTNSWGPSQADDTERAAAPVNRYDAWSSALAHGIHQEVIEQLKVFDRGQKIAHFGVLRGLDCPGVLVESGFLSNEEEARKIATPAYRQQIAAALADGIVNYAKTIEASHR